MLSSVLACCMDTERDRSGEHDMKCYKFKGNWKFFQSGNAIFF